MSGKEKIINTLKNLPRKNLIYILFNALDVMQNNKDLSPIYCILLSMGYEEVTEKKIQNDTTKINKKTN